MMQSVFWTGKLPLPLKLLVNMNHLMGLALGKLRDTEAMRQRVRLGFEAGCTEDLQRYDELGVRHFGAVAQALLDGVDLRGKKVLDVGCGTGIVAFLALERGAERVTCVDFAAHMLDRCRQKAAAMGLGEKQVECVEASAETLPFEDATFDGVVSSMLLGMAPDQKGALLEMRRVLKPGGQVALATHGIDHYQEGNAAGFLATTGGYFREFFGYRLEYWAMGPKKLGRLLGRAGFANVRTSRFRRTETFEDGGRTFDFYAATSGLWWFSVLPKEKRAEAARRTRVVFQKRCVTRIRADATLGYGRKP